MKKNKCHAEYEVHLGENIKHLMKAFRITQAELAEELNISYSDVCDLLQKSEIDDTMLQRIADAIGNGVTVEMIRSYNCEDTTMYIFNTYNNTVESGGTVGSNSGDYHQEIESQENNNYTADQAFTYAEKIIQLEKQLLYYRMKVEPEEVEREMQDLKKEGNREENK